MNKRSSLGALLIIILIVGPVLNLAQIRKAVPKTAPPVSKFNPDATATDDEQTDTANDFVDKGLPTPRDFGGPPSDKLAASLARELVKYDEDNLPLLITTLQRAGFFIINDRQKPLFQPTNGQGLGLAFYDYEVVGMYKLSRRGIVSSIGNIARQMGKDAPDAPPARISELLLTDLRAAANSNNGQVRFWARLIIELGRNAAAPVDLMTASADAPLSIIQASLLERRLIGDFYAFAERGSARLFRAPNQTVSFVPVAYEFQAPCQPSNLEALMLDGSSIAATTAFGKFFEFIQETLKTKGQRTMERVGNGLLILNLILSWAKLVAAVTAIRSELKIADPMPLERTKNADEGQTREMTAKMWSEVGNKSAVNCARLALNLATGLDFSMPNDGPLSERDVAWELHGATTFAGQRSSRTGRFDPFVRLNPPGGANRDPSKQLSDGNGESRMNLVGASKIPAVVNKPVVPVRKKAEVSVAVALKAKADYAQNFIDLGGAVIGTLVSGPLGVLGSIPELGFRSKIPLKKLTVPVKDWELCTADWAGTVDYTRVMKKSMAVSSGGYSGTRTIDERTEITWVLNPRTRDMPPNTPPIPADVYIKIDNSDIFEGRAPADVCCTDESSKDNNARVREVKEFTYSGQTKGQMKPELAGNLLLSLFANFEDYSQFIGKLKRSFTVSESACPPDDDQPNESVIDQNANLLLEPLMNTKTQRRLAPGGEGVEELFGTESFDDPRGGTIIYEWSLARCK